MANGTKPMRTLGGLAAFALPAASMLGLLLVWQVYTNAFEVNHFILPSPLRVLNAAFGFGLPLLGHVWTTTYQILVGFTVGNLLAVIIAYAIVQSPVAEKLIYPFLIVSQTVPKLAIAPLLVIWFGTGLTPKVIVIVLLCFFPTAINVVQGLRSTDPSAVDLVNLVTSSKRTLFFKVQFPSAVPYFFAGLKISMAAAVIGSIVAEWVSATSGLGYLILYGGQTMRTDLMFVAVLLTVVLGLVLYGLVAGAERLLSWKVAEIGGRAA
ncbi:MAG: ABC transporter permease [Alphaproteobacteria bacterium]|nr:ABC transporter permease [Alphaproteobacteria bacterium]